MGAVCSGGEVAVEQLEPEEKRRNEMLSKHATKLHEGQKSVLKMLLLGAGESGKSTIFKQMKVINQDGYSETERREFKGIIYGNVFTSMKVLIDAFEKIDVVIPGDLDELIKKFQQSTDKDNVTPDMAKIIKLIWGHPAIKEVFRRRNEFQLSDSTQYFLDDIDRLSGADYLPSEQDVLRSRVRTTGIVQLDFTIKSIQFSLFDVGGQRNERRKWIHCFDDVNAVVFVAACSEFDQKLHEDETQV